MKRITSAPRQDWQQRLEDIGFNYHTIEGTVYWNEHAAYEFTSSEIDALEDATQDLHDMCMELVGFLVHEGIFEGYDFTDLQKDLITKSWDHHHQHLYGRMDLGYDGKNIKLFEYNADTPTTLLEAAVAQWRWLQETNKPDQFNSIHETLGERFLELFQGYRIYFSTNRDASFEDWATVHYLLEIAAHEGIACSSINLESIGWNSDSNKFVDMIDKPIDHLFKLYPWEWLISDEFADKVPLSTTTFYEPAWKMLLSNKTLLYHLWRRYPNNKYLLQTSLGPNTPSGQFVIKPKLGREGQNIFINPTTPPPRDYIIQEYFEVQGFQNSLKNGMLKPTLGSWVVGDKACGMGIREEIGITTNNSQFVPHYFVK